MSERYTEKKPSNRQWKQWCKLHRKKEREVSGLLLAEGERCVEQILLNGLLDVEAVVLSESSTWSIAGMEGKAVGKFDGLYRVSDREFERLVDTRTPQGVAAICRQPQPARLERMTAGRGLVLAADGLQDPGNLGTLLRTAVWFGAEGLVCGSGTVDPYHPKTVRSTAGATGALPVTTGDLSEILDRFEASGWQIILLDAGPKSRPIAGLTPHPKRVLVVGNEADGIQQKRFVGSRYPVRIEGESRVAVESLNASIAGAIALYRLRELLS